VKRLKALEAENARLRRAVSDLTLDKQILAVLSALPSRVAYGSATPVSSASSAMSWSWKPGSITSLAGCSCRR
jgi:hypothetical protein